VGAEQPAPSQAAAPSDGAAVRGACQQRERIQPRDLGGADGRLLEPVAGSEPLRLSGFALGTTCRRAGAGSASANPSSRWPRTSTICLPEA
jgi:hypothetical protein